MVAIAHHESPLRPPVRPSARPSVRTENSLVLAASYA
jgi:hypothetical protein